MSHSMKELVEITVKNTLLKAHPVGKLWLTLGDEDPSKIIGGGWEKIKSYILQCSDDNHSAGTFIEAGLPDVKGGLCAVNWAEGTSLSNAYVYGACTQKAMEAATEFLDYGYDANKNCVRRVQVEFSASNSNSIYGKSDTVQPSTVVINVWKRTS